MNKLLTGLQAIFFPDLCPVCGQVLVAGERGICLSCRMDMPLTGYERSPLDNALHERLMCKARVERAASLFHYERRSPYARIVHEAKYNGRPSLGRRLMRDWAESQLVPAGFFAGVDLLVPVPLIY